MLNGYRRHYTTIRLQDVGKEEYSIIVIEYGLIELLNIFYNGYMKKSRWLYYTVGVAALPIVVRIIVFILMAHKDWPVLVNAVDFVFFGLTLNLSNMNELNSLRLKGRKRVISDNEREKLSGWSIYAIVVLCIILGFLYVPYGGQTVFNPIAILIASISLAIASFFLSFKVINKINTIDV